MQNSKLLCVIIFFFSIFSPAGLAGVQGTIYNSPDCFIYDQTEDTYYVSNVNGAPSDKNNNGFIVRLNAELGPTEPKFIRGGANGVILNAPKGIAIVGERLYVVDIDHVRVFDKKTGKPLDDISFKRQGATFLNDIAADEKGSLYVSATIINVIFRIDFVNGKYSVFPFKRQGLGGPNGLVYDLKEKQLVVICYGTTEVIWLDKAGKRIHQVSLGLLELDGIDLDRKGNLIFSQSGSGKIYRMDRQGRRKVIVENLKGAAGISIDRKRNLLLVPLKSENIIKTIAL